MKSFTKSFKSIFRNRTFITSFIIIICIILKISTIHNGDISGSQKSDWATISVYVGQSTYNNQAGPPGSQAGQDKTIIDIFKGKKKGYFVDLAANDAMWLSNTYTLETHYDWQGLCIEANSEYMWGLAHRKCKVIWGVAWNSSSAVVSFIEHPNGQPGWAGGVLSHETDNSLQTVADAADARMYPTITLENILVYARAPFVIDYFSLDIEGAEAVVLQDFPFDKYTFLTITVERPQYSLVQKLERHGYVYVKDHGVVGDKLYIHKSIPQFDEILGRFKKN